MSKLGELFKDSKKRNIILVFMVIGLIIMGVVVFFNKGTAAGGESAAMVGIPSTITQSSMGAGADTKNTSEQYLKILMADTRKTAEQAKATGGSALPTLIGGGKQEGGNALSALDQLGDPNLQKCVENCRQNLVENDPAALLNQWVERGQVSAQTAAQLSRLQEQGVSTDDYAIALNRLVREGKLTADQAKRLLKAYEASRNGANEVSASSLVDRMVTEGTLSPAVSTELRQLSDRKVSLDSYRAKLDALVQEGKLTSAQARELFNTYQNEQKSPEKEKTLEANQLVNQMLSEGKLSPEAANELKRLISQRGGIQNVERKDLEALVAAGKISGEQMDQLLALKEGKAASTTRSSGGVTEAASLAPASSSSPSDQPIAADVSAEVVSLEQKKMPPDKYAAALNALVQSGKLTPVQATRLLENYQTKAGARISTTGNKELDELQRSQQNQTVARQKTDWLKQQAGLQKQRTMETEEEKNKRLQALLGAMNSQSQELFQSWNPVPQNYVQGGQASAEKETSLVGKASGAGSENASQQGEGVKKALAKAGDIIFAVLDTGLNSDQPGPVMATIVSGQFKGARLLGELSQTPDGQRLMLKFTLMSKPEWYDTLKINAVAINPDDARTALASSVDNHYLLRFGGLFAGSFLSGYADAVKKSGSSVTSGGVVGALTGTTTQTPVLSPQEKLMVAAGEVGKQVGGITKQLYNTRPTVRIDPGVGLGILFLENLTGSVPVE